MTTEGVNHQLFVDVLAQIEKHPETWDQGSFFDETDCGTAYCFAGWANAMTGAIRTELGNDERAGRVLGIPTPGGGQDGYWNTGSGWYSDLFSACNTLDDLYRISADLMGVDETVLREKVAAAVSS